MSYTLNHTAEQIERKLSLINENKNLLPYPYDSEITLPDGLEEIGDGSFLLHAGVRLSDHGGTDPGGSSAIFLNDCILPIGTYIPSIKITYINDNPADVNGFTLKLYKADGRYHSTKPLTSFTVSEETAFQVYLAVPEGATFENSLIIKPQIEAGSAVTGWVPYMDKIGSYVDERFNSTNAKIKVLADNMANSTISGTVTKEIGGIAKDTIYTNADINTVLSDLLFPYVAPIFNSITLSAAAGTFEYGTTKTVSKVTPNFTKGSKNITSIKIGTTSGGADLYSGSSATSGTAITLTTSKTYDGTNGGTIYCTISDGTTPVTKSASVGYVYYDYSKLTTSTSPDTSGATKQTSSGADNTYSYTAGQYLWLYSRSSGKKIQTYVAGSWADVTTTASSALTLTLASGATETYYAYRTDKFARDGSARYRLA